MKFNAFPIFREPITSYHSIINDNLVSTTAEISILCIITNLFDTNYPIRGRRFLVERELYAPSVNLIESTVKYPQFYTQVL